MGTEILGIPVSNLGLREALRRTGGFFEAGGLNTIAYVSAHKLVLASENEEQKHWWSSLDLTVFEDAEVLKAAGITSPGRIREVEEKRYLKEFLRYLVKGQKEIFLLADTEKSLAELEEELKLVQGELYITGRDTFFNYPENKEGLINSINLVAPEVVLSRLPYPEGIHLMYEYGKYLNASVWLMLPEEFSEVKREGWLDKMNKFMYKKLLNKMINHSEDT